ncbi:LOW QUALITY PROTEIN: E3 ubiquitin-protein ligase ATL6 [Eucalyptus grandis]|uniref:LOW QUALITY PROTEIN: E3 ubiquitin-protein ligase ATL6 n=1 Tax=Eucalyptus grandis TaxID=71139 RepID=UPI00192E7C36|nr:LOW QUALITY PROTEIN: E3 ubiquitin-protein ligase ATL6 [Eucalyptus grandis]
MPPIPPPPPPRPRRRSAAAALLFLLLPTILPPVAAQPAPTPPSDESSPAPGYGAFSNSIGLVLVALVIVIFLLATFSAYILRCSPAPEGSIGRAVRSLRRLGAPPRGLDPAVVETFPTVAYAAVKGHRIGERSLECAVCLNDFEDDDTLRLIPKCDHAFHPDCIGEWLASHTTCPVCRADLASQRADDPESPQAEPPSVEAGGSARWRRAGEEPAGGRARADPAARSMGQEGERRHHQSQPDTWLGSRIGRFPRSHSTGHSLVRPGDDTERFTLRLPADVRKRLMMDRPGPALPQEGCSRRGYRYGEGSSRGRYYRRLDRLDSAPASEGWAFNRMPSFLVRMSSALSPRVAAAAAARSGGGSFRGPAQQARPPI